MKKNLNLDLNTFLGSIKLKSSMFHRLHHSLAIYNPKNLLLEFWLKFHLFRMEKVLVFLDKTWKFRPQWALLCRYTMKQQKN